VADFELSDRDLAAAGIEPDAAVGVENENKGTDTQRQARPHNLPHRHQIKSKAKLEKIALAASLTVERNQGTKRRQKGTNPTDDLKPGDI
jgi:hypothetical protein